MAAHSKSRLHGRIRDALACATLLAAGMLIAPARGQSSPPERVTPVVEVWQGNHRVDTDRQPVRMIDPPPQPVSSYPATPYPVSTDMHLRSVPLPPVKVPEPLPVVPPAPAPVLPPPPPSRPAPDTADAADVRRLLQSARLLTEECCSAIEMCRATVRGKKEGIDEVPTVRITVAGPAEPIRLAPVPAPTPPPPPAPPAEPAPPHAAEPVPARSADAAPWAVWGQVGLVAGAVLLCPLLVVLLAGLLIRRTGIQFRVEVVNSSMGGPLGSRLDYGWGLPPVTGGAAAVADAVSLSLDPEAPPAAEAAPTGEQFDLGPSYEEEQQAKADAIRQQELAILQHIYEENLRLHQEIAALGEPEGVAAEFAPGTWADSPAEDE